MIPTGPLSIVLATCAERAAAHQEGGPQPAAYCSSHRLRGPIPVNTGTIDTDMSKLMETIADAGSKP